MFILSAPSGSTLNCWLNSSGLASYLSYMCVANCCIVEVNESIYIIGYKTIYIALNSVG